MSAPDRANMQYHCSRTLGGLNPKPILVLLPTTDQANIADLTTLFSVEACRIQNDRTAISGAEYLVAAQSRRNT
jgi:hypothetical protein